ncbi:MAG TPA: tape measure protein [Ramlibacter sp.]|nr:tape measure protein [Ramlibacter sp.]
MSLIAGSKDIGITLHGDTAAFDAAMQQAGQKVDQFKEKTKQGGREIADSWDKAGDSLGKLYAGMRTAFIGGGIAAGIITLKNAVVQMHDAMLQAQVQVDRLRNGIKFALGGDAVVREINFLRENTRALGLEFESSSRMYMRLAAASRNTAIEGKAARDIFVSIGQAATVMGLSVEETQGALLAVTQMISKGKVQAEELRGQLGERLPGAFQIAARAMGVTTGELDKMLELGQVMAEDFLPKFAAQLSREVAPAVEDASRSMQASTNRLSNEWQRLKQSLAESGIGSAMAQQQSILADAFGDVAASMERAKKEGDGFTFQMLAAGGAVLRFLNPFNALSYNFQDVNTKLDIAKQQLREFEAQLAKEPYNQFLHAGIKDLKETVAWLTRAKEAKDKLAGDGPGESAGGFARKDRAAYDSSVTAAQKTLTELTLKAYNIKQKGLEDIARLENAARIIGLDSKTLETLKQKLAEEEVLQKEHGDRMKSLQDARFAYTKALAEKQAAIEVTNNAEALRQLEFAYKSGSVGMEDYYARKSALQLADIAVKERLLQQELKAAEAAAQGLKKEDDKLRALERITNITTKLIELGRERQKVDGPNEAALREWDAVRKNMEDLAQMRKSANASLIENGWRTFREVEEMEAESLDRRIGLRGDALKKELAQMEIRKRYEREALDKMLVQSSLLASDKADIVAIFERKFEMLGQRLREEHGPLGEARNAIRSLGSELEDSLIDGGHGAGAAIRRFFSRLVLSPVIQPAINGMQSMLGSAMGIPGATAAAANGGNLLSTGMSAIGLAGGSFGAGLGAGFGALFGEAGLMGALDAGMIAMGAGNIAGGLGTLAGALGPIALVAIPLIMKALKKKGGPKVDGRAGVGSVLGSGELDGAMAASLQSLQGQYGTYSKLFGGSGAIQLGMGISTDPKGTSPTFLDFAATRDGQTLFSNLNRNVGRTAEDQQAAIAAGIVDTLIGAMKADSLSAQWAEFFAGVAADASTEVKQAALQTAQAVKTYTDQFAIMGDVFGQLTDMSVQARAGLIALGGGLEALTAATSSYIQNFYTEEERRDATLRSLTAQFRDMGLALPGTIRSYRDLVDAQDLNTESGQKNYVKLMQLSGAFASLYGSAEQAMSGMDSLRSATDDAMSALERAAQKQRKVLEAQRAVAAETVSTLSGLFNLLRTNVRELYGVVDSTRATGARDGLSFIEQALATAQSTGYLPEQKALEEAIRAARGGIDTGVYASKFEADRDRLILAGKLSQLEGITGRQLTTAERELEAAEASLKALETMVESFREQIATMREGDLSLKEAMDRLTAALLAEKKGAAGAGAAQSVGAYAASIGAEDRLMSDERGSWIGPMNPLLPMLTPEESRALWGIPSHASGGLASGMVRVGEYGPEVIDLKTPGRVYTAEQTRGMFGGGGNTNAEVVAELRLLRKEVTDLKTGQDQVLTESRRTANATNGRGEAPMLMQEA